MLVPGAVAALLNDTLGLGAIGQKLGDGQFKMFEVSNVTVAGARTVRPSPWTGATLAAP